MPKLNAPGTAGVWDAWSAAVGLCVDWPLPRTMPPAAAAGRRRRRQRRRLRRQPLVASAGRPGLLLRPRHRHRHRLAHVPPMASALASPLARADPLQEAAAVLPPDGGVRETHTLALHTHASGHRMVNQYLVHSELGRGVHGRVRKATDTQNNRPVAIKIVDRSTRRRLGAAGSGAEARRRLRATVPALHAAGQEATHRNRDPDHGEHSGGNGSQVEGEPRLNPLARAPPATDDKVLREIAILKKCASEHVVRLLEVIDDPCSKKIFMGALFDSFFGFA